VDTDKSDVEGAGITRGSSGKGNQATIIVHSGELDKLMSAFVLANGFLSIGTPVTLFFTFWGLMGLRHRGFVRAPLSRFNLLGIGRTLLMRRMKKHNVASLELLATSFRNLGGKLIACTMTMELMGLQKKDLRGDLVTDYGTVGKYCLLSKDAGVTLFI